MQRSSPRRSRKPTTKPIAPEWMPKQLSTKQRDNSAPASHAKDVAKPSSLGSCTKRPFAKRKPSFARDSKPGQDSFVDSHSDHSIHADSIQVIDFFLRSYPARRNQLSG